MLLSNKTMVLSCSSLACKMSTNMATSKGYSAFNYGSQSYWLVASKWYKHLFKFLSFWLSSYFANSVLPHRNLFGFGHDNSTWKNLPSTLAYPIRILNLTFLCLFESRNLDCLRWLNHPNGFVIHWAFQGQRGRYHLGIYVCWRFLIEPVLEEDSSNKY